MMRESAKTAALAAVALALAVAAAIIQPESRTPSIMSDQGAAFYPKFTDPQAARSIEVIDYDEATATAQPLKVQFQKGRWVITSHYDYRVDMGDRLVKTAAALIDLKKDAVRSDSAQDHARLGVVDPLDQKVAGLAGRGKRVTLRDARGDVLADFIFGKPVEGKAGFRYVRVPGQKRVYTVKTDADPSARFADWVNAGLLRIAGASIKKVTINRYNIDEAAGRLANVENVVLTREGGQWKSPGGEKLNLPVVREMETTLDTLKIVDVRPKPPSLAEDLRKGGVRLSLETAMSLRQKGFLLLPNGRLLSNEGEMVVETANGAAYTLRFGELATAGDAKVGENRYLFVSVSGDAALNDRFADWYYVISGKDIARLQLRKKDLLR